MASRPDANGSGKQMGLKFSRLAILGPGGLLQAAVVKAVTIGRRLGDACGGGEGGEAVPEVCLFDPADAGAYPGLPPAPEGHPYTRVLVDSFIACKLRPHQVGAGAVTPSCALAGTSTHSAAPA